MEIDKELFEKLAEQAHISWSGWQQWVFEKSIENIDETFTIPYESVKRWKRQINTEYKDLSESEKESDRIEVREYLKVLEDCGYEIVKRKNN